MQENEVDNSFDSEEEVRLINIKNDRHSISQNTVIFDCNQFDW